MKQTDDDKFFFGPLANMTAEERVRVLTEWSDLEASEFLESRFLKMLEPTVAFEPDITINLSHPASKTQH